MFGQTKAAMVYSKAIHCQNGLDNRLAEVLSFSFALKASAQALDTILYDATQRSILIMIGEVMAECSQRHHFVDRCGVGIVPLSSEAGGGSGNLIEIV